jgi:hypothetical protein
VFYFFPAGIDSLHYFRYFNIKFYAMKTNHEKAFCPLCGAEITSDLQVKADQIVAKKKRFYESLKRSLEQKLIKLDTEKELREYEDYFNGEKIYEMKLRCRGCKENIMVRINESTGATSGYSTVPNDSAPQEMPVVSDDQLQKPTVAQKVEPGDAEFPKPETEEYIFVRRYPTGIPQFESEEEVSANEI